jgi:hypothetical protein
MENGFEKGLLTNSLEQALEYATQNSKLNNSKPVVCEIETIIDTLILSTARDTFMYPAKTILEKYGFCNIEDFQKFFKNEYLDKSDWRKPLQLLGAIHCNSWISPNTIKKINTIR